MLNLLVQRGHIPPKLEHFFFQFPATIYKNKELILRAGDEPGGVYFIASGFVRRYTISDTGKEFTINILPHGTFFPSAWLICDLPNQYFFEALKKTVILKAPKNEALEFIAGKKDVLLGLTKNILSGMNECYIRFPRMILGNSQAKIATVLLFLMHNFTGPEDNEAEVKLEPALTHKEISNLAGLSRETTTLELAKLAKEGTIATKYRSIVIKDTEKLEKLSHSEPGESMKHSIL